MTNGLELILELKEGQKIQEKVRAVGRGHTHRMFPVKYNRIQSMNLIQWVFPEDYHSVTLQEFVVLQGM